MPPEPTTPPISIEQVQSEITRLAAILKMQDDEVNDTRIELTRVENARNKTKAALDAWKKAQELLKLAIS